MLGYLLLHIQATNIHVRHIRFLVVAQKLDRAIGLRRKDGDTCIRVAMEAD